MKIIKKIKVEKVVEEEVVEDILCNKCGRSCKNGYYPEENPNYDGLIEVTVMGGYGAKLGDMTAYTFSICEDCLKEIFNSFKIEVKIEELNNW